MKNFTNTLKEFFIKVFKTFGILWVIIGIGIFFSLSNNVSSGVEFGILLFVVAFVSSIGLLPFIIFKKKKQIEIVTPKDLPLHVNCRTVTTPQINIDLSKAIEKQKSSNNPKFRRSNEDENLVTEFSMGYEDEVQKMENDIYDSCNAIGKYNLKTITTNERDEKIILCKKAIDTFEHWKKFCYSHGIGGTVYFQGMYENCHNSNNEQFSYIDSVIETLQQLVTHKVQ